MLKANSIFLILLSLAIILFPHESRAYERAVDSFSGKTTISSKISDGFANRIFVNKSIGLAFDSVIFSKSSGKNTQTSGEKTLDEALIKRRIDFGEALLEKSRKSCGIGDINKINDAFAYLSQAKTELEKKNFNSADCFEWKARSIYDTIRKESYTLTLTISGTSEWWFFSQRSFEMKIDNNPDIYKLPVLDTKSDSESSYNFRSSLTTTAIIDIPKDIVNLINNANSLTCRVSFSDSVVPHEPSVFEISGANLSQWKGVIRAE